MVTSLSEDGSSLLTTKTIANQMQRINQPCSLRNFFIVHQKNETRVPSPTRSSCRFEEKAFENRRQKSPIKVSNRRYKDVCFAHVAHLVLGSLYIHERQVGNHRSTTDISLT